MTVAVTTGNMASNTIMVILEMSNTPSQRITTGKNAIFGIGKPTEMSGIEKPPHYRVARHGHAQDDADQPRQ